MSKYQNGWRVIFEELPILKQVAANGYYDIDADTMKEITKYEPRLLAKIDSKCKLPFVMLNNGLSLLAIENGRYRISKENPFITIPSISNKEINPIKKVNGSVVFDNIDNVSYNEQTALHLMHYNNVLDHIFGEKTVPVMGGMRRGSFDFRLGATNFGINNVQIDTDGCYEGATTINVVEVKRSVVATANLRQLLYPKLMLEKNYNSTKKINVWLMTFDNEKVYNFYKFVGDKNHTYKFDTSQSRRYKLI